MRRRTKSCHVVFVMVLALAVAAPARPEEVVLNEVPSYLWYHGCSPTSGMMLLGYWDSYGYPDLISGSNDWATNEWQIKKAIASSGDGDGTLGNPGTPGTGHVPDYAYYGGENDYGLPAPIPDMSSLDPAGAHSDNCLADFMQTSRSAAGVTHGGTRNSPWPLVSDIAPGMEAYAAWRLPAYSFDANTIFGVQTVLPPDSALFRTEINFGRPVLLGLDTDLDIVGREDHSVTAIGYREENGFFKYVCRDTLSSLELESVWHASGPNPGVEWWGYGVTSMTTLRPAGTSDSAWTASDGQWSDESNWSNGWPSANTFVYIPQTSVARVDSLTLAGAARFVNNLGTLYLEGGRLNAGDVRNAGHVVGYGRLSADVYNQGTITPEAGTLIIDGDLLNDGAVNLGASASLEASDEVIGHAGSGHFVQTAGMNSLSRFLWLGCNAGCEGVYDLSGGNVSAEREYVGYDGGSGRFTQTGGVNAAATGLYVGGGVGSGAAATYELGGTGELYVGELSIGSSGVGTFRQNGGTNSISGRLRLLGSFSGSAVYELTDGELSASEEHIGVSGTAHFIQTGGSNTVANDLVFDKWGEGTYELRGGVLSVLGSIIGTTGSFVFDGGLLNVGGSIGVRNFTVASSPGVTCGYSLESGTFSASHLCVGQGGTGTFTQTGGTNDADFLTVGANAGSRGIYQLSENGQVNNPWGVRLGDSTGSSGLFRLRDAASLNVGEEGEDGGPEGTGGAMIIGREGDGVFIQEGGVATVTRAVELGNRASGEGTYQMEGGQLRITGYWMCHWNPDAGETWERVDGDLIVGYSGSGLFQHRGGCVSVSRALELGYAVGSVGRYELSDSGQLEAAGHNWQTVGRSGCAVFVQSGGTNMTRYLYLGYNDVADGTYELGGQGVLEARGETIGYKGEGRFIQTGGTHAVGHSLYLGRVSGSKGTYELSGTGRLSAAAIYVGLEGEGTFSWNGGALEAGTITVGPRGTLVVGATATLEGALWLDGGTVDVESGETFDVSGVFGEQVEGVTFTKNGDGVLIVSGPQEHAPGALFDILDGTVFLNTDAGGDEHSGNLSINVTGGAALNFGWNQHLDTLTISDGGLVRFTGANIVVLKHLVMGGVDLGATTMTPEPTTLALLAVGGMAMLFRKRKQSAK